MEDLWKVTRNDYRISAIAEQRDYEEIVRRYHAEETGNENEPRRSAPARLKTKIKK